MRREFTLSSTNPQFTVELTFFPSSIIVLNNTDKSVYLSVGNTRVPNATFFDREILPTSNGIPSNVALPNNSYQFAGYLPTPTDTTKNVKIIFQGTANPFNNKFMPPNQFGGGAGGSNILMSGLRNRHWAEYRLNASNVAQVMQLEFMADMCFILNNSDAWLYMNQGGTGTPNSSFNDLAIPPTSYTIFVPRGGFDFAGFLDSPSAKDCFIIFAYGYADEYAAIKQINGDWDWYLPPLTIPGLEFYFDFSGLPTYWELDVDLTTTPFFGMTNWVPGVGYRITTTLNFANLLVGSLPIVTYPCNINFCSVNWFASVASGTPSAISTRISWIVTCAGSPSPNCYDETISGLLGANVTDTGSDLDITKVSAWSPFNIVFSVGGGSSGFGVSKTLVWSHLYMSGVGDYPF